MNNLDADSTAQIVQGGKSIMDNLSTAMVDLAVQLSTLAVKGTATAVTNKVKAAKEIKDNEKLRNVYDEMVNELLNERDEAVRIA